MSTTATDKGALHEFIDDAIQLLRDRPPLERYEAASAIATLIAADDSLRSRADRAAMTYTAFRSFAMYLEGMGVLTAAHFIVLAMAKSPGRTWRRLDLPPEVQPGSKFAPFLSKGIAHLLTRKLLVIEVRHGAQVFMMPDEHERALATCMTVAAHYFLHAGRNPDGSLQVPPSAG